MQTLKLRARREDGATAVEYGIMVALIAIVIIAAVWALGNQLKDNFECVDSALQAPSEDAVDCE